MNSYFPKIKLTCGLLSIHFTSNKKLAHIPLISLCVVEYFNVSFIEWQSQTQSNRSYYNIGKLTANKSRNQTTSFKIEKFKSERVIIKIVLVSKSGI